MQFLEGREASVSVCSRARRALFCLVHQHLCARAQGQQRDAPCLRERPPWARALRSLWHGILLTLLTAQT